MKAMVLEAFRSPLVVREVPDPTTPPDGVIIRVEANGICRSDWHAWQGDWSWIGMRLRLPHVLGHEFAGVVEAVGANVQRFKPGDRVVVPFTQGDGTCEYCLAGHSNVCAHILMPGFSYWGGYGRLVAVPRADTSLVALPDTVDFVAAASLGCRFMTAFHGVVDQARVAPGEWVAVYGAGGVGLSAVHIAAAIGARPIAVDIHPDKLAAAREAGAEATVDARTTDPVEAVRALTGGGAHVAVDALGVAETCLNALASLKKRGRHLQIGMTTQAESGRVPLPVDLIVQKEIQFVGSLGMPAWRYPDLLGMVAAGKLRPQSLVSRTVTIDEAPDVLAAMTDFRTLGIQVVSQW
ncbi:MAG: zinc-dependent alcohol dehydrogenase family protein [Actinomycetia bacterium]|nr:zinc-dependent alcohol dehydrogenase family protein [Actinomycetes bacterium]